MTLTDLEPTDTADAPEPVEVEIGGVPISGLLAQADEPRAVLVALHGGQTTAQYFDCPGHPELSLLRTAARLGFTTLALDRPGYGSSAGYSAAVADPQRRVDLMYGAIDAILGSYGSGTFLLSHSAGYDLAVRMAVDPRGARLSGLALGGSGFEPNLDSLPPDGEPFGVRHLLWYPADIYPPDLLGGASIGHPRPDHEGIEAHLRHRDEFPAIAAQVPIPMHITFGEHEKVWRIDDEALTAYTGMYSGAPRIELEVLADAGHNLSLGYRAVEYHEKVLAFAAECLGLQDIS